MLPRFRREDDVQRCTISSSCDVTQRNAELWFLLSSERDAMTTPGKAGSVAVLCFLPDYGHLQPVLKIADALAERGFESQCDVPDECEELMRRFPFDVTLLPNAQLSEPKRRLAKVFARGLFFNAACSYVHYLLCYPRIAESASAFAPELRRRLG